jgi:hypothetical protein
MRAERRGGEVPLAAGGGGGWRRRWWCGRYRRRKKEEERKVKASGKKEVEKIRWVPPLAWGERAPDSGSALHCIRCVRGALVISFLALTVVVKNTSHLNHISHSLNYRGL